MKNEIYISIKDLIAECIRKAWIIVIAMLVFAALLGGYKYKKDLSEAKSTIKQEEKNTDQSLAELSKAEYNKVMSYINFNSFVKQQEEYLNNSLIMSLDPYHADVAMLQYYVNTADENSKNDAVVAYLSYIKNGAMAEDMYEIDKSVPIEDIKAAIYCDATGPVSSNAYIQANSNVINIMVYGNSKKQCAKFSETIKTCLTNYNTTLNSFMENTITIIDESYSVQNATALVTYQTEKINNLSTANVKLKDLEKDLDDSLLALAERIIALEDEETTDKEIATEETVSVGISAKFIVIGAFAGIIIAMCAIVLIYIVDGRLKTDKELKMMYGIRTLGSIEKEKPTRLDKLSNAICYRGIKINDIKESAEICASQIVTLCANLEKKEVLIVGDKRAVESLKNIQLIEKLKSNGINATYPGDILNDADAVSKLSKDKCVIIIEKARASYYVNIEKRINEVKNQGIEILGYITVR